jgi:serine/threonine protein kinase
MSAMHSMMPELAPTPAEEVPAGQLIYNDGDDVDGLIRRHPIERDFYFPANAKKFHSNNDSSVWEMVHAASGAPVVAKGVADGPDVRREVAIHRAVAGPGILPLLAVYEAVLPSGHKLRPKRLSHDLKAARVLVLITPRLQSDMLDALSQHITARSPVPRALLATYVQQMVAAVAHVHACGYTHADVKLENFFLSPPAADGSQAVLLGDFGHAGPTASLPTRFSFGTALYRSPEGFASHTARAAGGEHAPLHPCMDVWALGVATLVLARVVHLPVERVLPFGSGRDEAVYADLVSEPVWAAIHKQLQQRAEADGSSIPDFAAAALAWDPADRPDTSVLPLQLL